MVPLFHRPHFHPEQRPAAFAAAVAAAGGHAGGISAEFSACLVALLTLSPLLRASHFVCGTANCGCGFSPAEVPQGWAVSL